MHCQWQIGLKRSVALLTVFGLCACAAQSYYNPYANRRAAYSPYSSGYNALQPRRSQRPQQLTNPYATYASPNARPPASSSFTNSAYSRPLSDYFAPSNANDSAYNKRLAARRARLQAVAASSASKNAFTTVPTAQRQPDKAERAGKYRVSKADAENAKFAGALNQETEDESTKTLAHLQRKRLNRLRPGYNRCSPFGRDAAAGGATPSPTEQGRFLWDVNVYNIYPNGGGYRPGGGYPYGGLLSDAAGGGCGGGLGGFGGLGGLGGLGGGLGGGGLGGGLLSDPVAPAYPEPPLNTFLSLFAPGILQNALAATARPPPLQQQPLADPGELGDLASDPEVDPGYNPAPARPAPPVRRPNRIYYDSPGASPITPAQLVGGVATTVNGIIQQLTGNVQPVYPSYRRAYNTGK